MRSVQYQRRKYELCMMCPTDMKTPNTEHCRTSVLSLVRSSYRRARYFRDDNSEASRTTANLSFLPEPSKQV
jgi:hypothetical protein